MNQVTCHNVAGRKSDVGFITRRPWSEKREQASLASGAEVGYRLHLGLACRTCRCTSSVSSNPPMRRPSRTPATTSSNLRTRGSSKCGPSPATVCYSTQSYPGRPIDLIAKANGALNRVASYEPQRTGYCDRAVEEEIAAALLSDPSSFVIKWSPQAGEPVVMTPLTPTSSM